MKQLFFRVSPIAILVLVLLTLLPLWATQVVAQGQSGKRLAEPRFSTFFLPFDSNTERGVVAMDEAGGLHVAYSPVSGNSTNKYMAYYAYCATDCADVASWNALAVGEVGYFGGYVRLELDPQGKPRMLWVRQSTVSEAGMYVYAACTESCLGAANWQSVDITSTAVHTDRSRYFAVDPQGRPRFFYTDTETGHVGTFYRYCDSNCLSASSWREGQFSDEYAFNDFSLTFDSTGRPRLAYAYSYTDGEGIWQRAVGYAECNTACGTDSTWASTLLYMLGVDATFSLRLDSGGQPRLALFPGYFGEEAQDYLLYYTWCSTGCTEQANWSDHQVPVPPRYGYDVDLMLDEQDQPHLAYAIDDMTDSTYGVGYAVCTAGCQGAAPTWQSLIVETVEDVQQANPVPPKEGCSISVWMPVGRAPSLALDGEGNPYIAYDADHAQGGTCAVQTDIQLVRFASSGGGGSSSQSLYLPLLRKP